MRPSTVITCAVLLALGSAAVVGGKEIAALAELIARDQQSAVEREAGAAKLARDVRRQTEERAALIAEINRLESVLHDVQAERQTEILALRSEFQTSQDELRTLLSSSTGQLSLLESSISEFESAEYPELIQEINRNLNERWSLLEARINSTDGMLASTSNALASIDERIATRSQAQADLSAQWNHLMGPVVKLSGSDSVGSGVRLESVQTESGYRTLVLTAWHVVRDIIEGDPSAKVPVTSYDRVGISQVSLASLIDYDVSLDVALLEIDSDEYFENGAQLASRESVVNTRVFQKITAVGCPLGNDPVPSRGEVSDTNHYIDGNRYWMINAPTFIGNSGGGIFDSETLELVGIFSKIYNYGSTQQTIIPHMGLMTPLDRIYDWINRVDPTVFDRKPTTIAAEVDDLPSAEAASAAMLESETR